MVYLPTWLNEYTGFPLSQAMKINTAATALLTVLIPLMAWISDRYIRRTRFIFISITIIAVVSIPFFLWVKAGTATVAAVIQIAFALLITVPGGVSPALFVELFPTNDRLSGYSIAFNVGMGIVGGSTPMIVTWLISKTNIIWFPAIYMVFWAIVCLIALSRMKDRSREPLQ
jgi:MHS family proline/betaine transporter-like MFS transporter